MSARIFVDLTGQVINNRKVLEYLGSHVRYGKTKPYQHKHRLWKAECILCGEICELETSLLNRQGCGCQREEKQSRTKQSKSLEEGVNPARNRVWNSYIQSAKARDMEWSLTPEEFDSLIFGTCHYCGNPPSKITYREDRKTMFFFAFICFHNGIDRKDSSIGYCYSNCLSCCATCNYAKRDKSYSEFIEWAERLSSYRASLS